MADLKENRKLVFYVCGWCHSEIYYTKNTNPPVPCPECGWRHLARDYNDVPSEIKISLNDPSMT